MATGLLETEACTKMSPSDYDKLIMSMHYDTEPKVDSKQNTMHKTQKLRFAHVESLVVDSMMIP